MQINNLEKFKAKAGMGELCLGMVITLTDPVVSEQAGELGWDFTWIDMEHAPLNIETVLGHVMALRGTDTAPFVRVPGNDPFIIKPVLELAPAGIIIPLVNSPAEAESAVKACRYPPRGIRGCGPRRGTRFGRMPFPDYLRQSKGDPMIIVQIEHRSALKELDSILSVEGIGSICIGPCDLSASMGKLGQGADTEVEDAIDDICTKARKAGVMISSVSDSDRNSIEKWIKRGAGWLGVCSDYGNIGKYSIKVLNEIKPLASHRR